MIHTGRRIPILFTALATLALAGVMLALFASPVHASSWLEATASHDSVELRWWGMTYLDPDDIAGYVILRWDIDDQAPGFAVIEENAGTTSSTYTDSSVEPDTRYIYRVDVLRKGAPLPQIHRWEA